MLQKVNKQVERILRRLRINEKMFKSKGMAKKKQERLQMYQWTFYRNF